MKKHQFKPFDQVLVRNENDDVWHPALFKSYNKNDKDWPYICDSSGWKQCIPYNEETMHLYDTSELYKEPEPKVWRVVNSPASFDETYTDEELSNFIKTAVINNKDITNFHVMYIPNN